MVETDRVIERAVVRAIFHSAKVEYEDIRWRRYSIDAARLASRLSTPERRLSVNDVEDVVRHLSLFVLRSDALKFNFHGFEKRFDRQTIAEGLGAGGVQFFPTRESANRSAVETSREAAYYGFGDFASQFLACPIDALCTLVGKKTGEKLECGTVLRDLRDNFAQNRTACEMLTNDRHFEHDASTPEKYVAFQQQLRSLPFSEVSTEKLISFFNRSMTIGIRDSIRWSLGARHPRFDWTRAKKLIEDAFVRHGKDDFNTPQLVYYTYDPSIEERDIQEALLINESVVSAFANEFRRKLNEMNLGLGDRIKDLNKLCYWILDIHHDYPDFDLECTGGTDAAAHIDFLGHSIQNSVNTELLGDEGQMRRNLNFQAHFHAHGLDVQYLSGLDDDNRSFFFDALKQLISHYDAQSGITTTNGIEMYHRLPMSLFVIQRRGDASPLEGERVLDSFDLSRMTELEHASYIRSYAEISEKLAVFFMLTLRHVVETDHAPDLRPRAFLKDFLVLGLWGTRTPNLLVNLYVDKNTDENSPIKTLTRAEIKFVGCEQVEIHAINHLDENAKVLRFAVAHCLPLIEPSILRNIGTFTMALDEFAGGSAASELDAFGIARYGIDMLREIGRVGIKGSIGDALSLAEFMMDNTFNGAQKKLAAVEKFLRKHGK